MVLEFTPEGSDPLGDNSTRAEKGEEISEISKLRSYLNNHIIYLY